MFYSRIKSDSILYDNLKFGFNLYVELGSDYTRLYLVPSFLNICSRALALLLNLSSVKNPEGRRLTTIIHAFHAWLTWIVHRQL
uniref:Uncharacterized protein n=1 Tax=Anguilla anguilla TaxID=7936 RepID=A0A0E9WCT1_ANGAN